MTETKPFTNVQVVAIAPRLDLVTCLDTGRSYTVERSEDGTLYEIVSWGSETSKDPAPPPQGAA